MFIETEIYKYGLLIENVVIDYLESNEYEIIEKYNNDNSHDIIVKNKSIRASMFSILKN